MSLIFPLWFFLVFGLKNEEDKWHLSTQLQGGLEEPARSRWEGGASGESGSTDSGVSGVDRERWGWKMAWGRDERGTLGQLEAREEKQGLLERCCEQVDNWSLGKAGMEKALLAGAGTGGPWLGWNVVLGHGYGKERLVGGRGSRVTMAWQFCPFFMPS